MEVHRPDSEPGIGVTMTAGSKRPSNRGQRPRSRGSGWSVVAIVPGRAVVSLRAPEL